MSINIPFPKYSALLFATLIFLTFYKFLTKHFTNYEPLNPEIENFVKF